ncbi:D-hexose-6-phosphate mutarotase [Bifidobacterium pullorum]|uniref:D-hexose-6-phosphate mutarotase n=1 Tax=Bifidobacterium pullorum TaxID=78448 RepID=UPI0025A32149|nr:D-hexose-6-phosphate mutarotase [Bifidobacterium pullorum]MDM8323307.1 D-hexose-6-phosphate mutarotase [Bifidobacterium pullorum]
MNTFLLRDVVNADSSASISDYGAHVLTWTPAGQPPVIWRPAAVQLREGTAIRGGVPIIFPWFNTGWDGGRPVSKQPKHGFGRVAFWSFDADASSDRHVRYTLDSADFGDDLLAQLNSGDHPRFRATYDVEIGERIAMALTVANDGDEPLTYEAALHTYLHVGDVERIAVHGLESCEYLDNTQPGVPHCSATGEPITFDGMVDRTYLRGDEADAPITIDDPVLGRTIEIVNAGAPQAVVWNPGQAAGDAMGDLATGEWRGFVCVEAVARLDRSVTLAPGQTHTLSQTLSVH